MLRQFSALGRNLGLLIEHFAGYFPLLEAELRACVGALGTRIALFVIAGLLAQAALIGASVSASLCLAHVAAWHWAMFAAPLGCLGLALIALAVAMRRRAPSLSVALKEQFRRDVAMFHAMSEPSPPEPVPSSELTP